MKITRRVVLHFPRKLVEQPIICRLVKDFDLDFNILKASVTQKAEGLLVLGLTGKQANYDKGIKYLADAGVNIQLLSQSVNRTEDRCNHCGSCLSFCPSGAFEVDPDTKMVAFVDTKCIACGMCIKACPFRAMELQF